jgi:hypothetical protein
MSEIKEFFAKQESGRAVYTAVIIYHPAFGEFRLVKDYIGDITFNVDGVNKVFMGAMVQVPEESILSSDDVDKGKLSFDRVGYDVMSEVRKIDDYPTLVAAEVRVLTYIEGVMAPQNDYSVFVENFNFSDRQVTLDLTTRNLSKSTKNDEIFDPDEFVGLRNV